MIAKKLKVTQTNNRVIIAFDGEEIFLESDGFDLPIISDFSFALLCVLPLAMERNIGIDSDLSMDSKLVSNSIELSKIWRTWVPERFNQININVTNQFTPNIDIHEKKDLYLYSGGIDSTYMLLNNKKVNRDAYALTIHGLDYKLKRQLEFDGLINKTKNFTKSLDFKRIIVKTNMGSVLGGLDLNHGFCLASVSFLFKQSFSQSFLASDHNLVQESLVFPWGTNSITNKYFSSSNYALKTHNLNISRIQKIEKIFDSKIALRSIIFCSDSKYRPNNCGRCSKCIRTKMMFLVKCGFIPKIFLDNSFTRKHVKLVDLSKRNEVAFTGDLLNNAIDNNKLDKLFGLQKLFSKAIKKLKKSKKNKLGKIAKKILIKIIWFFE